MPRTFEYSASLDGDGTLLADGSPLRPDEAWTPEHFVLAGLMRCTLQSLRHHAEQAAVAVGGSAVAEAVVTKRDDGRYEGRGAIMTKPELERATELYFAKS